MADRPDLVIYLPVPPSANRMFRRSLTRTGRRDLTPEYKAWRDAAGWEVRRQMVGAPIIACRFNVVIEVPISRKDTDNHAKPLLDICQNCGAISNDGNQHSLTVTPADRSDVMVAFYRLPEMNGIRPPYIPPAARKSQPKATVKKHRITAARLAGLR